jgi:nucleoside-diphosphate-sugar epimerase
MSKETILLTGATGFIGSHLAEALLADGHQLICPVRNPDLLRWLKGLPVELVKADLSQPGQLGDIPARCSVVVHVAGITKAPARQSFFQANALAVRNLLLQCLPHARGIKRVTILSSLAAIGPAPLGGAVDENTPPRPVSWYGKSKLAGEMYARRFSTRLPLTILRPCVVYGPRDRDMLTFFKLAARGIRFVVGTGKRLSMIHVYDLVRATIMATCLPRAAGKTYMVANPEPYWWDELVDRVAATLGKRCLTLRLPDQVALAAGGLASLVQRFTHTPSMFNSDKARETAQKCWVCNTARIERELGFAPLVETQKGLEETARWYKQQGWI